MSVSSGVFSDMTKHEDLHTQERIGLELARIKEEILYRCSQVMFTKFSVGEFPQIKELNIQMGILAKTQNHASIFWKNEILKMETRVAIMERKLSQGNKGGIKSRERRKVRREQTRKYDDEESWNKKKITQN